MNDFEVDQLRHFGHWIRSLILTYRVRMPRCSDCDFIPPRTTDLVGDDDDKVDGPTRRKAHNFRPLRSKSLPSKTINHVDQYRNQRIRPYRSVSDTKGQSIGVEKSSTTGGNCVLHSGHSLFDGHQLTLASPSNTAVL